MNKTMVAGLALLLSTPLYAGPWTDDCKHSAPRRASTPAAGVSRVFIHAESGYLKINGASGATQISADGVACTSDEDFLSRMNLTFRKTGSDLQIDVHIPEKTVLFGFFNARLDLNVTVPAGIPLVIEDSSGSIRVTNSGPLTIEDSSGSIDIKNVRGPLKIDDESGSIDIDTVAGNVDIDDDSGELIVRNVTGNVVIEDSSGSIEVAAIEGSLHIRNDDSGSIAVRGIRRDVTIDEDGSGSVDVADIGGNFTLGRKGSGNVDYVRVAGQVNVGGRTKVRSRD